MSALIALPTLYAGFAYIMWMCNDKLETRARLPTAHLVYIGVIVLYAVWNIIFIYVLIGYSYGADEFVLNLVVNSLIYA